MGLVADNQREGLRQILGVVRLRTAGFSNKDTFSTIPPALFHHPLLNLRPREVQPDRQHEMCSSCGAHYLGAIAIDAVRREQYLLYIGGQGCAQNGPQIAWVSQIVQNQQSRTAGLWTTSQQPCGLKELRGQNTYHSLRCLSIAQSLRHTFAHLKERDRGPGRERMQQASQ